MIMRLALVLLVAAALPGCTVGPDFERPSEPATLSYLPAQEQAAAASGGPTASLGSGPAQRWWEAFGSGELNALVDRALEHNQSLAASNATLAAAREEARAIVGRRAPQIDAHARVEQEQSNLAAFGFSPSPSLGLSGNPEFHLYSVGGGISYDLDLFGGLRRQVEEGGARAEAQQRQTEAAHLALAGQVVSQVLTIAAVRARIATAEAIVEDDRRNVELTRKRQRGGEGTLVETLNAESQYAADRTAIPLLQQRLLEARHLLATLVGVPPAELGVTDFALERFILPGDVPVTLPSALVRKRPDILQAEAELHAATAAVGVASARLYPDITLGATLAQGASNAGDLLKNAFRGYDVFAGLTAPIFHGGTLKARQRAAIERARAADASYRQTVLGAFEQVANLLSSLQTDAQALEMQRYAADVAGRSLRLSRRSFEVGNSGILQVLDSERLYQRASADLVEARARQYLNVARLYVATGGGWLRNELQASR
jgi:NodT family efflux transporter outer membrane factor (OMF) lipoprotein